MRAPVIMLPLRQASIQTFGTQASDLTGSNYRRTERTPMRGDRYLAQAFRAVLRGGVGRRFAPLDTGHQSVNRKDDKEVDSSANQQKGDHLRIRVNLRSARAVHFDAD